MTYTLRIIIGPPCAGKSTYVENHRAEGDLVIDFDIIAGALGFPDLTRPTGLRGIVKAARVAMIDHIVNLRQPWPGDIWVIDTHPVQSAQQRYGRFKGQVEFHVLNPGVRECKRRADADERPGWTYAVIDDWYNNNPAADRNGVANVAVTVRNSTSMRQIPMKRSKRPD